MKILIVFLIVIAVNAVFRGLADAFAEYFTSFFFGWMGGMLTFFILLYLAKRKVV